MTETLIEARARRSKQLRAEANLKFREADALRRLADEADQAGLALQCAAWECEPW